MPLNKAPSSFFGPNYAVSAGNITLPTFNNTSGVILASAVTFDAATDAVSTGVTPHGLKVKDRVRFTSAVGSTLAAPLVVNTNYWVHSITSTTQFKLSDAVNGGVINLTTAGTGSGNSVVSFGLLDDVTDTEAHPVNGDWRRVISGLMHMLFHKWSGTSVADRPSKVTINRSSTVDNTTSEIIQTYTVRVVSTAAELEVAEEP